MAVVKFCRSVWRSLRRAQGLSLSVDAKQTSIAIIKNRLVNYTNACRQRMYFALGYLLCDIDTAHTVLLQEDLSICFFHLPLRNELLYRENHHVCPWKKKEVRWSNIAGSFPEEPTSVKQYGNANNVGST